MIWVQTIFNNHYNDVEAILFLKIIMEFDPKGIVAVNVLFTWGPLWGEGIVVANGISLPICPCISLYVCLYWL